MADFQVRLNRANNYRVTQEKTVVAENLSDLADVSVANLAGSDNYVMIYNASLGKYTLVPADNVLSSAVSDNQLPSDFINQLDTDLDDKIDLDAGTF